MLRRRYCIPSYILLMLLSTIFLTGCTQTFATKRQLHAYTDNTIVSAIGDTYTCNTKLGNDSNFSTKDFTGCMTMWETTLSKEETYLFTYSLDTTKGKAKIVLIAPDNTITILSNQSNELALSLSKGLYRVKFVGKHTNTQVSLQVERKKD